MINNHFPYLFKDVSEGDYIFLKQREPTILKDIEEEFKKRSAEGGENVEYFRKNKPSFRYNARRQVIGIFLKYGRSFTPILSREDIELMSGVEKVIFFALRDRLEENLEGIKMRREEWR